MPRKSDRREKSFFPIITGIAVVGILVALYVTRDYLIDLMTPPEPFESQEVEHPINDALKDRESTTDRQASPTPAVKETSDQSSFPSPDGDQQPRISCAEAADAVESHLQHLATYFDSAVPSTDGRTYLNGIIHKLLDNPPIIVRETDNLITIRRNLTHFYRILGPVDIIRAKEIMADERQTLEQTLATLYSWSEIEATCPSPERALVLPLENLYEYAGFFLNTLGGRSYLFRRTPGLRLLVQYYAVLIVDRAETASLNRYGIDIRPALASLIGEIKTADFLADKDHYLETLYVLEGKYLARYGSQNDEGGI